MENIKFFNCNNCKSVIDTIEHHLYSCPNTFVFWTRISDWLEGCMEVRFKFTICEILLGLPNMINDNVIYAVNFIIVLAKFYINRSKTLNKHLYLFEFQNMIKSKLKALKLMARIKSLNLTTFLRL